MGLARVAELEISLVLGHPSASARWKAEFMPWRRRSLGVLSFRARLVQFESCSKAGFAVILNTSVPTRSSLWPSCVFLLCWASGHRSCQIVQSNLLTFARLTQRTEQHHCTVEQCARELRRVSLPDLRWASRICVLSLQGL